MTGPLHVSAVGAILAAIFAGTLTSLLWWMLRVPQPVPLEVARAVRSVDAVRTILVPILDQYYSERAVELASRLGQLQKARILLGYVVEVPRTLSLGVPLPGVDERAKQALDEARQIVRRHALEAQTEIIRAREAGEGICRVVRDRDVDLIVLGISPDAGLTEGSAARVAESLFRQCPCEVIIDRVAETTIGAPSARAGAVETSAGLASQMATASESTPQAPKRPARPAKEPPRRPV